MNRRDFLNQVVIGAASMQVARLLPASAGTPSEATPDWLTQQPLIIVGSWDSSPLFQRRRGGESVLQEAEYEAETSEATVRKLKDVGVTLAVIHFFKGFGLEAERPHIEMAKKLAVLLHQNGIKVGLYVGSTIAYETFLVEKPEAESWFVPNYLGRPVIYDKQTFRKRVYFMHPGYVEYMKRVVRMGVEELKADEMDFDNTSYQARPEIFQHPLAIKNFREYLTSRYTADELTERLGFSNVEYVEPPKVDFPLTAIDDPLFQEWAGFRCHQLNRYYAEMHETIKQANPNTVIATNPSSGIAGRNTIWDQGVYYPTLMPNMDICWTEEGDYARVNPEGILISKIRTYKMVAFLGKRVLTYTAGSEGGGKLAMAEAMAYNRQTLGMVGGFFNAPEIPDDQKHYINFFRNQFGYYRDVESVADVAVLYSYASMGFNNDRPEVSFMLFTQALIQARVPFEIIFDGDLADLSKYRVLVLADQECLDDGQMNDIRNYVRQGGGLVATEQTSLYTPWRLRRPDFGLADLFQAAAPQEVERGEERDLEIAPVRRKVSSGRVSYIAAVKPAIRKPPSVPMNSQYWKLPLNWEELIGETQWATGGKFRLEVNAPETLAVTVELLDQPAEGRRIVHLLNYAAAQGATVTDIGVEVELPSGKRLRQVTLLSPDGGGAKIAPSQVAENRARFTVPRLETYTLAILEEE
ncbi:MAG: hypothetical protein ACRD2B_15135 [Terriglobia bacterium]